jgi:hypothetical protein
MLSLEIPLILLTFYFIRKFKRLLKTQTTTTHRSNPGSYSVATKHLIEQEDRYMVLKKMQSNLVFYALLANFALHLIEIVLFYAFDHQEICDAENDIQTTNGLQLGLLWLENVVELFPHFIIPFIFWYLPAKINTSYQTMFVLLKSCRSRTPPLRFRGSPRDKQGPGTSCPSSRWAITRNPNSTRTSTLRKK